MADKLGVPVASVRTLTLGLHGDTMVPVPSACTVDGRPLAGLLPADEIEQLVTRTRNGGGEIVALLKTGSAVYAPSAAAARMARAVAEDSGQVMPVCAGQHLEKRHLRRLPGRGRPRSARLGVCRIVERDLSETELAALRTAAQAVRAKQADVATLGARRSAPGQAAQGQFGDNNAVGQDRVVEHRVRRVVGRRGQRVGPGRAGAQHGTVNLRSCGRSANHISLICHTRPGESRRRTGENRPRIAQVDTARRIIASDIRSGKGGWLAGRSPHRYPNPAPRRLHTALVDSDAIATIVDSWHD